MNPFCKIAAVLFYAYFYYLPDSVGAHHVDSAPTASYSLDCSVSAYSCYLIVSALVSQLLGVFSVSQLLSCLSLSNRSTQLISLTLIESHFSLGRIDALRVGVPTAYIVRAEVVMRCACNTFTTLVKCCYIELVVCILSELLNRERARAG